MSEYADLNDYDSRQLDRADLQTMSLEEIDAARRDGRLARLLANADYVRDRGESNPGEATRDDGDDESPADANREHANRPRQLTREDLAGMSHEEIDAALKAGQLTDLLA